MSPPGSSAMFQLLLLRLNKNKIFFFWIFNMIRAHETLINKRKTSETLLQMTDSNIALIGYLYLLSKLMLLVTVFIYFSFLVFTY